MGDRQTGMADLGMEGQIDRSREVWRYKQKDVGTDKQADRMVGRQAGRQTDRRGPTNTFYRWIKYLQRGRHKYRRR